jgi:hypothetical protein
MIEYYILTQDPNLLTVLEFIRQHELNHEIHFNRTRFWVPLGPIHTEFSLRFSTVCARVESPY